MAAQIEGQERFPGPETMLIDGQCDQFLTGAALAGDQDGNVLPSHPTDRLVHFTHSRANANDGTFHVGIGKSLGHHGRLAHSSGHFQRRADDHLQLPEIDRFEQVVEGPLLHRLDRRVR